MKKGTAGATVGTAGKAGAGAGAAGATGAAGAAKPRITLAQKKKREKYAEEIIETLPLEYRSNDPVSNGERGARKQQLPSILTVRPPSLHLPPSLAHCRPPAV